VADSSWRVYGRFLPHWRADAVVYFVTWRLHHDQEPLTPNERDRIVGVLRYHESQRYDLYAYVIMDDHVHVLVEPTPAYTLEQLLHSWKSYSAHLLLGGSRRGRIWQREYYDRIIRSETDLIEKINYIVGNPARRWPGVDHYPWAWCRDDALA
jgi:REP element-mobilizing transposase RayT